MKVMQLTVGVVGTNCYIVYDEATREAAVIDPGDNAKSILHAVAEEKLTVRYVLLTHAHFDHILAVHDVLEATRAQFVCPEADTWLLSRDNMGQFRSLARSYVQDTPDILAGEGTAVTFGGLTGRRLFRHAALAEAPFRARGRLQGSARSRGDLHP